MTLEMARMFGIWGGAIAAVAYCVMAYAFFKTSQIEVGVAYVCYAVSNVALTMLLLK